MKAMILAAGEGTRLRPYTLNTPKPMLPVGGRPTLEWIVLWLRHYGIRDFVVNLCHCSDQVLQYFGDGSALGVHVDFSVETTILGTAGGLKKVESLLQETFVVAYGDTLTNLNLGTLAAFHHAKSQEPHVTLSLARAPRPWECGVVAVDKSDRVVRFVEKPPREEVFSDLTNAGTLIVDPPILQHIPANVFYDISRDLLPKLMQLGVPIFAQPVQENVYQIDMGTADQYERAQREWPAIAAAARFVSE